MALTDLTRISTSGIATGTSLSGAILHGDAHFRGTQVGVTSALFDSSDNALEFNDNVKLTFGNNGDLKIYHDTSNGSYIQDAGHGQLRFLSNDYVFYNAAGNENLVRITENIGVSLYDGDNTVRLATNDNGVVVTGILTATGFSGSLSNTSGISTFYDLRVSNNLTVEGTTSTIDTTLIGVDRVEVGANSNSIVGVAITQSGTADIVNLFDGATKVVTVDDVGNVGIGSAIPAQKLDVAGKGRFSDDLIILNGKILTLLNDSNTANIKIDCDGGARLNVKSYDKSVIQAQENWGIRFFQGNETERFVIDSTGGIIVGAGGTMYIPDKITHYGDNDTAIRFPAADVFAAETGGSERLRCDADGVKTLNGRFYSAGTFAYIESSSTSTSTLTLKKSASGADSIDYLQLRDNSNAVKFKISGDGILYSSDVLASHEGDTDTKIRFPAADTIQFETAGDPRIRITNNGRVGINTTIPSVPLDVVGSAAISSALSVGGALSASGTCTLGQTVSINGTNPQLQFVDSNHNPDYSIYGSNGRFSVYDATNSAERFRISSTGKITHTYDGTAYDAQYGQFEITKNGASNADPDWSYLSFHRAGQIGWQQGIDSNHFVIATTGGSAKNTLDAEKLRILSTGEVGIGITNPTKTGIQNLVKVLQIDGGDGAELILGNSVSPNVSTNHIGAIAFKNIDTSTGNAPHYAGIRCNTTDTSGNMNLKFYTGSTNFESDSPQMTIKSNGQIVLGSDGTNSELTFSQDGSTGTVLNSTTTGFGGYNTFTINSAAFVHKYGSNERVRITASGDFQEKSDGTNWYNVVTGYDIGTNPNEIPVNQMLGGMAYMDPTNYEQVYEIPSTNAEQFGIQSDGGGLRFGTVGGGCPDRSVAWPDDPTGNPIDLWVIDFALHCTGVSNAGRNDLYLKMRYNTGSTTYGDSSTEWNNWILSRTSYSSTSTGWNQVNNANGSTWGRAAVFMDANQYATGHFIVFRGGAGGVTRPGLMWDFNYTHGGVGAVRALGSAHALMGNDGNAGRRVASLTYDLDASSWISGSSANSQNIAGFIRQRGYRLQ